MSLYKYVTPERIDIIKHGFIRYTQPFALNDPFEMKPVYIEYVLNSQQRKMIDNPQKTIKELAKRKYNKLSTKGKSRTSLRAIEKQIERNFPERKRLLLSKKPSNVQKFRENVWDRLNARMGVLCFTKDPRNLLMWSHYARNHEGFVIEFDDKHPYFNRVIKSASKNETLSSRKPSELRGYLQKVKYSNKREMFPTSEDMIARKVLFAKSEEWKYEKEWRMLEALEKCRNSKNKKPHKLYLFKLPIRCIKRIIFGANMSVKEKDRILTLLKSNRKYSHIKVSQVTLDRKKFKLKITSI